MSDSAFKGLRCLGLCRASSDKQTHASIPQQVELLQKVCDDRQMHWVGYEKEIISGSEPGNRDDLARLMRRKKTHDDYDVLMFQDRSRLTRAGQEHAAWLKVEFGRIGVKVIATTSKMYGSRFDWIEEGLEDEAAHDYVVRLSHNMCRGTDEKRRSGVLPHTSTCPFGIDRLYVNAEDVPLHIIRDMQDGSQLRLHPKTSEVLEVYPREQPGEAKRHYRKQRTERAIFIPGVTKNVEIVRWMIEQHWVHGLGYKRIALMANDRGWLTKTGHMFSTTSVEQIVKSPAYAGYGISHMWACGKFHNQDKGAPKVVEYDLYEMMGRKRKKAVMRPPEEWVIVEYPQLKDFLGLGEEYRQRIWKAQKEYWEARATGNFKKPNRDKHKLSKFFLKGVLRSKHSGMGLVGRTTGKNRYYFLSRANGTPDRTRPWEQRHVPAERLEEQTKLMVKEVLSEAPALEPLIRNVVQREADRMDSTRGEIESLEKEQSKLDQQVKFALGNLADIGEDVVKAMIDPLKEQRRRVTARIIELQEREKAGVVDVEATVRGVQSDLLDLANSVDGMPPQVLRNLLLTLGRMVIDMESMELDFDLALPSWAIFHAGRIRDSLCFVTPTSGKQVNETQDPPPTLLASFKCSIKKQITNVGKAHCVTCSRKAA